MSGTTAILKPKLNATLRMPLISSLRVNNAAISVYPGKKSKNGIPKIMRTILDGKKIVTKISAQASKFRGINPLPSLILNRFSSYIRLA